MLESAVPKRLVRESPRKQLLGIALALPGFRSEGESAEVELVACVAQCGFDIARGHAEVESLGNLKTNPRRVGLIVVTVIDARLSRCQQFERGNWYIPCMQMRGIEQVAEGAGRAAGANGLVEGRE